MAITYGLTDLGFAPMPFTVVRQQISDAIRAKRGPSTDVSDGSLIGVLIAIFSERESSLWDVDQVLYNAFDPDAATGASEDAIAALTGTFRSPAKSSTVLETLTGIATTSVPAGTQIKTSSTGAVFATDATCTIGALVAWANTHAYVAGATLGLGDRVTNATRTYECITSGTSAGSGGPTTTSSNITDGTAHWKYLGEGTGAVDQGMSSLVKDAITAVAGDLTVIQTPVGGLQTAVNLVDATPGALVQTDESLRVLRIAELSADGNSPADAIRAKLLKVAGVTSCTVYHNDADTTDGNGLVPHSVLALVQGGVDADIASTLALNVAAGIGTNTAFAGATVVSVTDSQGTPHNYAFKRPTAVPIYVDVTLKYDALKYPSDGDAEVKNAIATFGNTLAIGRDAIAVALGAQAFTVAGVYNVPRSGSLGGTLISTSASPTADADIVISIFQLATYDTSRVTVHSSAGTP